MALQEEFESQGNYLFKYRGIFPIIILVIGFVVYLQTELHKGAFYWENDSQERAYEYFCLIVSMFGLVIRSYTVGHTPANTSGNSSTVLRG